MNFSLLKICAKICASNVLNSDLKSIPQDLHDILRKFMSFDKQLEVFDGEYKKWHIDGHLIRHCWYKHNELDGKYISMHYFSGKLKKLCYFREGRYHGSYKRWFENGQIWKICEYKMGQLDGEYLEWHENGTVARHCFFHKGLKHGQYKCWSRDGVKLVDQYYENGKTGLTMGSL